ncbi:TVP38/TMEM64 family protein [Kineosporia babensis]|uniref:TVP38/TMEM64 family membrane protein n=1 Tax=Kineosporia babensis TaxID=499548 RepID=A0A9X1NET4_9ACTN|nr:TVP38/TMEM64 family protein [Kineosporia babensis]
MQRPGLRLISFVLALVVIGVVVWLFLPVSAEGLRSGLEGFGWVAGPVFVVVSALLGLVFVPGPLLAAATGALFGTWLGFGLGLCSSVLTSVLALLIARRAGAPAVEELSNEKVQALTDLAREHGIVAVTLQRLIPGIPDTPVSYAFGLIGLRAHQIALGTLIGSAPRGFAYVALGDAAASGDQRLAVVAAVIGTVLSLVGVLAGSLLVRRRRSSS